MPGIAGQPAGRRSNVGNSLIEERAALPESGI